MIRDKYKTLSNINDEVKKPLPILAKSSILFGKILNTPLTMNVTRYWESICNKTKFLFSFLAKRQNRYLSLTIAVRRNIPEKKYSTWKNMFVPDKSNGENYSRKIKSKHEYLNEAWPISCQRTPLFQCFPLFISVIQQVFCRSIHWRIQNTVRDLKWCISLKILWFFWDFRGRQSLIKSLKINVTWCYIRCNFWQKLKPVRSVFSTFICASVHEVVTSRYFFLLVVTSDYF